MYWVPSKSVKSEDYTTSSYVERGFLLIRMVRCCGQLFIKQRTADATTYWLDKGKGWFSSKVDMAVLFREYLRWLFIARVT